MTNDKKKELLNNLLSNDIITRRRAIMALKNFADEETIKQIEKLYNDVDTSVRYFAKKIVKEIKDSLNAVSSVTSKEILPSPTIIQENNPLTAQSQTTLSQDVFELNAEQINNIFIGTDSEIKIKTLEKLFSNNNNSILPLIIEKIKSEPDEKVISLMIKLIGKLGGEEYLKIITPFLNNSILRIIANTIEALELVGTPKTIPYLVPFLNNDDNRIKANAIKALSKFKPTEMLGILSKMVKSDKIWMRDSAIYALGQINNNESVELLNNALYDSDINISKHSFQVLSKIELPLAQKYIKIYIDKIEEKSKILQFNYEDVDSLFQDISNTTHNNSIIKSINTTENNLDSTSPTNEQPVKSITNNENKFANSPSKKSCAQEQGDLGLMYKEEGVPKDGKKTFDYLENAALRDSPDAQFNIGKMYQNGERVPQDDKKAFEWLEKAAMQGNDLAQINLAFKFKNGKGVPKDDKKAFEWFEKAAVNGNSEAQFILGSMFFIGESISKDNQKAFEWFEKAALQGYAEAQLYLGIGYMQGAYGSQDYKKSYEWFEKAATNGNSEAQCRLGMAYQKGEGVSRNAQKAFEWLEKAALQGYAEAQFYLGNIYHTGEGVLKDDNKAIEWFEKAAVQGHINAQFNLGIGYKQGTYGSQDYKKSYEWFEKAAMNGDVEAQFILGTMNIKNMGGAGNIKKAIGWFEKAALQGHVEAQCILGIMYSEGKGVSRDDRKSFEWFEKAAAKGYAEAQYNIGRMYFLGKGVSKNDKKCNEWIHEAAMQGYAKALCYLGEYGLILHMYPKAYAFFDLAVKYSDNSVEKTKFIKKRDELEDEITSEEIKEGKKISRELNKNIEANIRGSKDEKKVSQVAIPESTSLGFNLSGKQIIINDEQIKYNKFRQTYKKLSALLSLEYSRKYSSYGDMDTFIKKGLADATDLLNMAIQETLQLFVNNKILDIDENVFLDKYGEACFSDLKEAFQKIYDEYMEIVLNKKQLSAYQTERRENRGKVIGGGFGLKGAIQGMLLAGAINLATNAAHGIYNMIESGINDAMNSTKKSNLYKDEDTIKTLCSGIEKAIFNIHYVCCRVLKISGPNEAEIKQTNVIFNNLKRMTQSDERINHLIEIIQVNPYNKDYYYYFIENFGDSDFKIEQMADYFGVDVKKHKNDLISKVYSLSINNYKDNKLIDERCYANIKKNVEKAMIQYGVKSSQILTEIDTELSKLNKITCLENEKNNFDELIKSVKSNDLSSVKAIINKVKDINLVINNNDTALLIACREGFTEIAEFLISKGANVNQAVEKSYFLGNRYETPLKIACRKNNIELAKILIKNKADVNARDKQSGTDDYTELMYACNYTDNIEIVKVLLENGADINLKIQDLRIGKLITALDMARNNSKTNIVKLLENHKECNPIAQNYELTEAAKNKDINKVIHLLEKGVDINSLNENGYSAFDYACINSQVELAKLLLQKDATTSKLAFLYVCKNGLTEIAKLLIQKDFDINVINKDHKTVFMFACENGHLEIVKLLIQKGTDINAKDSQKKTAFMFACENGHLEIAKLLINLKININEIDHLDKTSLIIASEKGHLEIVKLLVENNANINVADGCGAFRGWTALSIAKNKGHTAIFNYLKSHGATE